MFSPDGKQYVFLVNYWGLVEIHPLYAAFKGLSEDVLKDELPQSLKIEMQGHVNQATLVVAEEMEMSQNIALWFFISATFPDQFFCQLSPGLMKVLGIP